MMIYMVFKPVLQLILLAMSSFDWFIILEVINDFQPQTSENDHVLPARSLIVFNETVYVDNRLI